jgi:hypothetical protein
VSALERKSCPGALTKGIRHRGSKGIGMEHQAVLRTARRSGPARGCPEEALGEQLFRAKAKRRKAFRGGVSRRAAMKPNIRWHHGCSGDGMAVKTPGITQRDLLGSAKAVD